MTAPAPTTLVLLASEQLWPNLHSIEYWAASLRQVLIYYTPDEKRSTEPARRLEWFCRERHPRLAVTAVVGPATPEGVVQQLTAWRRAFPDDPWMVNATGGTKLMFDGAVSFRGRPGVRVVYRELGARNLWYELGLTPDGRPTAAEFAIPAAVTDRIPVQTLIRTLWETDALPVTFGPDPAPLDVLRITRELIAANGDWRRAFTASGVEVRAGEQGGHLFERYVAAALLRLGLRPDQVAHSVRQAGGDTQEQSTQEVDLVVNHQARLGVIDCKLRDERQEGHTVEGVTSQLRQAAQTVRQLGGLSGEAVLLRPNREFTPAERALADGLRVRIIDRSDRGRFFARLAEVLGLRELPDDLRQADALLQDPGQVHRVFPPSTAQRVFAGATGGSSVVNLEQFCGDWARGCGQDWTVVRIRGRSHYLQCGNARGQDPRVLAEAIREALERFGSFCQVEASGSGNTLFALFDVEMESEGRFRRFLEGRLGRSFVD